MPHIMLSFKILAELATQNQIAKKSRKRAPLKNYTLQRFISTDT
tara:strand:- start:305 stop:436 length:132 start_codon:yes stop_codon:yes gene_type:complete